MARKPRNEIEAAVWHVYARGVDKQPVFRDDVDRRMYLSILARVVSEKCWRLLAYCLMDNHVHLLIETREPNLGRGMQRLHGDYASAFNVRHGRVGHVFQGRFGAVVVGSDPQLWTVAAYIARNPVEAGYCRTPGDWEWSSHSAVVGGSKPPWLDVKGLLGYFVGAGGDPLERYAAMVADAAGTEGTVPAIAG